MKTSEQINELCKALSAAQGEIENAVADSQNPHFRSSYADLSSVRNAIRGPMAKHGLSLAQSPTTIEGRLWLTSRLMHSSGQYLEDSFLLNVDKPTMQGLKSAVTYARRTATLSLLGLAETDDDGNEAEKHPLKPQSVSAEQPKVTPIKNKEAVKTKPKANSTASGITDKQRAMLWARVSKLGYDAAAAKEFLRAHSGKEHSSEYTREDFDRVLGAIELLENKEPAGDVGDAWEPPYDAS